MFFKKWLKNRATILIHCGIISIHSNLKWEGDYIMSDDNMQTMMSLMLAEMREMRSDFGEMKQDIKGLKSDVELLKQQNAALINGQTVLTNSIAEVKDSLSAKIDDVKDTLSAKIEETQKDNKVSKEISRDMLYDIAELKKKVK